jgi:hypothetical protein
MKRNVLFAVAFFATLAASAQNIAAVSPSNVTTMYQTLDEAVSDAAPGSIIYLPGGGFQISDETKITNKLTIMGVSHRGDADNADGATVIAGNLNFEGGSSGSSVVGAFISGNINVGTEEDKVTNLTVRFCNVNSIHVKNSQSSGMIINQCYIRSSSSFGDCNVSLKNNILLSAENINGGIIDHNVITSHNWHSRGSDYALQSVNNSSITNNFLLDPSSVHSGSNCYISNNCLKSYPFGENPILIQNDGSEITWENVFVENKGVQISSNYNLAGDWGKGQATDGSDIGIYGGSGFKEEKSLAPIPRIVSKKVDEHTDGSGMLHIEVTVKAD